MIKANERCQHCNRPYLIWGKRPQEGSVQLGGVWIFSIQQAKKQIGRHHMINYAVDVVKNSDGDCPDETSFKPNTLRYEVGRLRLFDIQWNALTMSTYI
jgi:hypothetical protein